MLILWLVELVSLVSDKILKINDKSSAVFILQFFLFLKDITTMVLAIIYFERLKNVDFLDLNGFVKYGYDIIRLFFNLYFLFPIINLSKKKNFHYFFFF